MDRKSAITLALCGALFLAWYVLTPHLFPPPAPGATNQLSAATNGGTPGTNATASIGPAGTNPAAAPLAPLTGFTQPSTNAPEQTLIVSNGLLRLTFTSHGGGIKLAELLHHRESVACGARKTSQGGRPVTLNGPATLPQPLSLPILALAGGPADSLSGDGVYQLSRYTPRAVGPSTNAFPGTAGVVPPNATGPLSTNTQGIRAEKLLSNGVYLVKEFELGSDYLIEASVRFQNRGGADVALPPQSWMVGAATPLNAQDNEQSVGLTWYDTKDSQVGDPYFENRTLGCFPGTPRSAYTATSPNIRWAAAKNQFFFIALMAEAPGLAISAGKFTLPPPGAEEIAADAKTRTNQFAFNVVLTQPGTNIAAGTTLERRFRIYAGPKEYRRLERLAADMGNDIAKLMEFGFFGWFSRLLLLSMNGLNALGLSYALAIITITVIIKLLFWPLTQASTRSMKRMQALQPQMKALQEKYKEDPVKMNKKLMEFMKENKVSPLGGCLPLLLQIPVFIGFFQMVRTAIELRGATFLWACDLSRPDTVFVIPGLNFNVNPLPLLMGITMFWQASLTPPAPGMDPMQQKMMKYFPLIFLFILYDYSAGLTLYWTVQNLLSIAQTKLTRLNDGKKTGAPAAAHLPRRKK
jgi:YidC/Oxa1 family membrane protein insertase